MAEKDEDEKTIAEDLVVTKYKMAAEIVNRILTEVCAKCVENASVREICEFGDQRLLEEIGKVFKKDKEVKKGIAFPTCISVNHCICHFSPLRSEPDYILQDGDMAKIDLGAHLNGFIAVVAHTVVVGLTPENKLTGRKADVIMAAHLALEAALRLVKPDNDTYQVTDAVQKIAQSFKCKPIEGMLSHELKQFKLDGEKSVIQNPNEAQRKDHKKAEFEVNEVYAVDVLISTGEGVGRPQDARVTIYKKTEETYMLKMKMSRSFYHDVTLKHGSMAFNLRGFEDEKKAKMAIVECVNHKLIDPFHVMYDKPGEFVAQFKFTVLLMPTGSHKITGIPFDTSLITSEYKIEDKELETLLSTMVNPKTGKKKKKKVDTSSSDPPVDGAVQEKQTEVVEN